MFFLRSLKRSKSRKGILESLISKVILIRSSLVLSALINSSSKSLGPVQTTIMSSITSCTVGGIESIDSQYFSRDEA